MPLDLDELNRRLLERLPPGLMIPPPCLTTMRAQPLDYVDGEMLAMRFPVLPDYRNPLGYMQGGFVVAALDKFIGSNLPDIPEDSGSDRTIMAAKWLLSVAWERHAHAGMPRKGAVHMWMDRYIAHLVRDGGIPLAGLDLH